MCVFQVNRITRMSGEQFPKKIHEYLNGMEWAFDFRKTLPIRPDDWKLNSTQIIVGPDYGHYTLKKP